MTIESQADKLIDQIIKFMAINRKDISPKLNDLLIDASQELEKEIFMDSNEKE